MEIVIGVLEQENRELKEQLQIQTQETQQLQALLSQRHEQEESKEDTGEEAFHSAFSVSRNML